MTSNPVAGHASWATLMARLSSVLTAPALEWRVEPDNWPATADRRDGRPIGALILAIAAVWLAVAVRDLLPGGTKIITGLGAGGGWLSLAIGAALATWGCRVLTRCQSVRIDHDHVHLRVQDMLGTTSWSEPLAHYQGVVWRSEPIRRRGAWQTIHLIELGHDDPSRTVTLFSSTSDRAVGDLWQAWAHRLRLAPLRAPAPDASPVPEAREAGLARSH